MWMAKQKLFPGVYVPVITPFNARGTINFAELGQHIRNLIKEGVDGIVVGGTTGEGHALNIGEKKQLIDMAMAIKSGLHGGKKFRVIAGTGTQNLREATEITAYAKQKGCSAALALPPKTQNQGQIEKFYVELGAKVPGITLFAYNIPSLTGVHIEPQTVARLVRSGRVDGVKDSSQDQELMLEWKRTEPRTFLIVGEDKLIYHGVTKGKADAVIPGTGNIATRECIAAFRRARLGKGEVAQRRLNVVVDYLLRHKSFGGSLKLHLQQTGAIKSDHRRAPGQLTGAVKRDFIRSMHI